MSGWRAYEQDRPPVTLEEAVRLTGWPVSGWPSNCFAVASAIVEHCPTVKGRAVYGHWLGDIHPASPFAARPIVQHGWIELDDGRVLDPTRFVFEHDDPYLFVGHPAESGPWCCVHCNHTIDEHDARGDNCEHCGPCLFEPSPEWPYDEGGNQLRDALAEPCPGAAPDDARFEVTFTGSALAWIADRMPTAGDSRFTVRQLHWLAGLSLDALDGHARDVYEAIMAAGHSALIPFDNRVKVLGSPTSTTR